MSGKSYKERVLDECVSLRFYRDVIGEFVGTMLLVAVQASLPGWTAYGLGGVIQVALGMGFVLFFLVTVLGDKGGANLNPAVTIALTICGRTTLYRATLYIVAQAIGGITGAALVSALTPDAYQGSLAATVLHEDITIAQGIFIEAWITFMLVFAVFGATAPYAGTNIGKAGGPLSIGLALTVGIMIAFASTGGSMNPARTLGPAVITGIWTDHWVYWVGPIFGGCMATLVYYIVCVEYASEEDDEDEQDTQQVASYPIGKDQFPKDQYVKEQFPKEQFVKEQFVKEQYPAKDVEQQAPKGEQWGKGEATKF